MHPHTQETWDIAPLIDLMQQLGTDSPALLAESIYDIGRYITAEQYSSSDTAARLRLMLARLDKLAVAFDSIQVAPATALPPMRVLPG